MSVRLLARAVAVVLLAATSLQAASTKSTTPHVSSSLTRQQRAAVKALRAEERAMLKAVDEMYKSVIEALQGPENQLKQERLRLEAERKQMLAQVADPRIRRVIRTQFEGLLRLLTAEGRQDKNAKKAAAQQKKAAKAAIRAEFAAAIQKIEGTTKVSTKK